MTRIKLECPNCNEIIIVEIDEDNNLIINCDSENLHNNNYEIINSKNIEFG
ncbi:hypothetical protein [Clostridium botulinum]|uniref:hypothetical protein n=1 Tax=Clostridium botulinum TaxID=1491 RepID=UPI000AFCA67D|nr:hypothetical protein [Clostridium botulinum]